MFGKKKASSYDPAAQKPVLRCSICTGEQVAGKNTFFEHIKHIG